MKLIVLSCRWNSLSTFISPTFETGLESLKSSHSVCIDKLLESRSASYKALGNAVPPVLMWHIANSLLNIINMKKIESLDLSILSLKEKTSFYPYVS